MRLVALLSGGIDSPVAAHRMLSRGAELCALHMDNRPFTEAVQLEKVRRLVGRLEELHGRPVMLFRADHGKSQSEFREKCDPRLQCVLCKRMMLRVASAFALGRGAAAVVTGESLGQVASQTLQNLRAEHSAARVPVLRPLIGLDKQEIVDTARAIGTYELSIAPAVSCTALPPRPATAASIPVVEAEEARLDIEGMVRDRLENIEEL